MASGCCVAEVKRKRLTLADEPRGSVSRRSYYEQCARRQTLQILCYEYDLRMGILPP